MTLPHDPSVPADDSSVADPPPERSLFQRRILGYQRGQDRTKDEAVSTSASMLIMGVVLFAAATGFAALVDDRYWVLSLIQLIGAGLFVVGIVATLHAAGLPTKVVPCPSCDAEHTILERVTTYICPTCLEVLHLGARSDDEIDFVSCPYCDHRTATSPHHGPFACSDCGVPLDATGQYVTSRTQSCPVCGVAAPEGALFCTACDHVFDPDYLVGKDLDEGPPHDMDWVAGKGPLGHLIFAEALLRHLDGEVLSPPTQRHDESPLTTLERAMLSLTEVASDPELGARVPDLVPAVDEVYGKILNWEADLFDAYAHAEENEDEDFVRAAVGVLYSEVQPQGESHIEVRRELERIMADDLQRYGSVGPWEEGLVTWKDEEVRSNVSIYLKDHVKVPDSTAKLRAEAERFGQWMTGRGSVQ